MSKIDNEIDDLREDLQSEIEELRSEIERIKTALKQRNIFVSSKYRHPGLAQGSVQNNTVPQQIAGLPPRSAGPYGPTR